MSARAFGILVEGVGIARCLTGFAAAVAPAGERAAPAAEQGSTAKDKANAKYLWPELTDDDHEAAIKKLKAMIGVL